MTSYEWKDFIHMSRPDLSIFHPMCYFEKISVPTYSLWPSKNISLSNNVYSCIIKSNQKTLNHRGGQMQWNKKQSPCAVGCGIMAETILQKSPGPFPCCLLTVIIFSMFDPFPVSLKQASWNSWNLLSFIGQVMISGIQFDNHTLEEYQTLKIEYSTLNEENKGL